MESCLSHVNLSTFDPTVIPFQYQVINDIRKSFDYSLGTHEILLSGALGSSKTTLMAHLIITHCLFNNNARALIGRLSMPSLRVTIYQKILEHLSNTLEQGKDYFVNETTATIKFRNGSQILSRSWADKQFFKVRSLDLSCAAIEELTESNENDFYLEIKMRVGRCIGVKENFIISATNPDDPSSVWYDYFELPEPKSKTKHVYYSITEDNPFLPPQYIQQLKRDLDPKMAQRMLYGKWLSISQNKVYYEYTDDNKIKIEYKINEQYPIHISFDFNIGDGKPLSLCMFQFIEDKIHIFDEIVIEGMRTLEACDELSGTIVFNYNTTFIINGDAAGRSRDTRNIRSDYDIISHYLSNYRKTDGTALKYEVDVPLANPPIRLRHNTINAYCKNSLGDVRLFVYPKAKTVDKGLRLVQLKEGGNYIEDDSKPYQHVTTACGYGLLAAIKKHNRRPSETRIL